MHLIWIYTIKTKQSKIPIMLEGLFRFLNVLILISRKCKTFTIINMKFDKITRKLCCYRLTQYKLAFSLLQTCSKGVWMKCWISKIAAEFEQCSHQRSCFLRLWCHLKKGYAAECFESLSITLTIEPNKYWINEKLF